MSLEKIIKSTKNKLGILAAGTLMTLNPLMGCGESETPTSPGNNNNPPNQHIEYQQETTNQDGFSYFNDDGTRVEIQVKGQNNTSISNAAVHYINGENNSYDIFIVSAPNYLSTLKPFKHNSKSLSHVINLVSTEVSNFTLNTLFGTSDKQALLDFIENYVPQASTHAGSGIQYNGTKTTEQILNSHIVGINLGLFALSQGTSSPILKILSTVAGFSPTQEILGELTGSEVTWDNYKPMWLSAQLGINMPSNKPTLNLNNVTINDSQLTINATTQDLETYLNFIPDPTNRILGSTENFDPTYTRKIIKINLTGEEVVSFVQNISNPLPWTINFNQGEGDYRLELTVTDDTGVNTTQDQENFTVGSPEELEGKIVFERQGKTYIINPNGSDLHELQTPGPMNHTPTYNPIRNEVAFTSNRDGTYELYTINLGNNQVIKITENLEPTSPRWNYQGDRIVFQSGGICIKDFNTGLINRIFNESGSENCPSFNQLGNKVTFLGNQSGNWEIYSVQLNGVSPERLTNTPDTEFYPYHGRFTNKIVFTKNHDIHTMEDNGSNVQNITESPGIIETHPCISPDGTKIIFQKTTTQEEGNLYIMNIDGTNQFRLTNSQYKDNAPDWR